MLRQGKHAETLQTLGEGLRLHPFASDEMKALAYEYLAHAHRGIGEIEEAEKAVCMLRALRNDARRPETDERSVAA